MKSHTGSFIFEFDNELSPEKCSEIIQRFENSKDDHYRGRVGPNFEENDSVKQSTDMVISGKDSWKDIDELFFISLSKALAKMKKEYDFSMANLRTLAMRYKGLIKVSFFIGMLIPEVIK